MGDPSSGRRPSALLHLAQKQAPCRFCDETIRPVVTASAGFLTWEHVERGTEACPDGQRWALP